MNLGLGEDLIFRIVSWSECYSSCIECELLKTLMPMNEVVGGIYSPQPLPSRWQSLLAIGAPDSPVRHRTVTVYCPVRAMSARPLGFGQLTVGGVCLFVAPGSPMASDFCRDTIHHYSSDETIVGAQGAVAPPVHRTVR
jgi:hypothetical protein